MTGPAEVVLTMLLSVAVLPPCQGGKGTWVDVYTGELYDPEEPNPEALYQCRQARDEQ